MFAFPMRLLKYSRSEHLVSKLGEILQFIAQSLPEGRLLHWIPAIGLAILEKFVPFEGIGASRFRSG